MLTSRWNPVVATRSPEPPGALRHIAESLVLLSVAVILFRCFAVEGYMISTGSMAPTLLGYHHRIGCPDCRYLFTQGAAFDRGDEPADAVLADFASPVAGPGYARCPNCGVGNLSLEMIPRNEGDQLLVRKNAFIFRDPRRWEVIVFRNPGDPRQAYVKRVAGLPGERIEIRAGEVFADGALCRKPYLIQRATHIPVYDEGFQPTLEDPDWEPRWKPRNETSRWQVADQQHIFQADGLAEDRRTDWLEYRHWVRAGGMHETSVELSKWPESLARPSSRFSPVTYEQGRLVCVGVLTDFDRRRWLARSDSPAFQDAINELSARSHVAPVTDDYGYNGDAAYGTEHVQEFMLSLVLKELQGEGRFELELSDGERIVRAVLDFRTRRVRILMNGEPIPVKEADFPAESLTPPMAVDFSLIDSQVILALNGQEVFPPLLLDPRKKSRPVSQPARIGASGMNLVVDDLRLYRDIYYTQPDVEPFVRHLGNDEFFVLGDNSPVSVDSRIWEHPGVPRQALIGKPFVVHLPSQPGRLEWRGRVRYVAHA